MDPRADDQHPTRPASTPRRPTPARRLLTTLRREPWRLMLVAAWLLYVNGGRLHPDAEVEGSLREELATMTADPSWVPGHLMTALGTVALALGLWGASRSNVWPDARRSLRWGALVIGVYCVETVFHLLAVVDSERLAAGEAAPVAFGHIGLALVLYPVSGLAIAWVAFDLGRCWRGATRLLAVPGIVGGLVHAASVPATMLFPDVDATPMFATAGLALALWSLCVGLAGTVRDTSHSTSHSTSHGAAGAPRIGSRAGAGAG